MLNLIRISKHNLNEIPKILDLGADGIIIANIEDVNEMEEIIKLSYFLPPGKRGLGYSRFNNFLDLKESLNINPILIPMIENLNSFKNLIQILKFKKNIDALFLGPIDLSLFLSHKLKFGAKYKKIIYEIKRIAKLSNMPIGIHCLQNKKDNLSSLIKKGFKFIAYSTDTEVINNYKLPKKI